MALTLVGSAKGTNTATAPAHQAGDLMLVVTTRNASATAPTLVSGFINIGTSTANTNAIRAAWKPCTGTSDSTGTWTNATECICTIWRPSSGNVAGIGQFTFAAGSSATASYTGFTLSNTSGTSLMALFGQTKTQSVGINGSQTNFTLQQDELGTGELVFFDSNSTVSTFSTLTQSITSGVWKTFSCEILDLPAGSGANLTNIYQHVAGGGNPFTRGNTGGSSTGPFLIPLPNSSGAGNCLVLSFTCDGGATVSSVKDNINGTWGAASVTALPGSGNQDSRLYIFSNITAGQVTITVTFSAAVTAFQYCVTELYNIDATPSAGTTSRSNSSTQNAGSFTPTNNNSTGGNFIYYYACKAIQTPNGSTLNVQPGGSFTLLNRDHGWNSANDSIPKMAEGFVQATSAAITPSFTSAGDTADPWNSLAIALKINTSTGTAPSTSHIQPRAIHHFATLHMPATGTYQLGCPAYGNLRMVACDDPSLPAQTVTDNEGNTWTSALSGTGIYFFPNAQVNPNLIVFITGGDSATTLSWRFVDIFNADPSPLDTGGTVTSGQTLNSVTSFTSSPSPTPTSSTGLTIGHLGLGAGPGLAVTAPASAVWDLCTYPTLETDFDLIENADIMGHFRYTASGAQTWTWSITSQASNSSSGGFVSFKEKSGGATANGQATFSGAGSFTANAKLVEPTQATFAGAGNFTANAQSIDATQATFTGTGNFTANGAGLTIAANFTGAGGFTANAQQINAAQATFAGAGLFTAISGSSIPKQASATMAGAGNFTDSGLAVVQFAALATFAGAGTFTANATAQFATQATFAGAGNFTDSGLAIAQFAALATFAGAGNFAANAGPAINATQATFAGAGSLTANALVGFAAQATFTGTGSFVASVQALSNANFSGAGAFTANVQVIDAAQATFAGAGAFTANGVDQIPGQIGTANVNGAGNFTANAGPTIDIALGTFAGAGSFTANAFISNAALATFAGAGALSTSTIQLPVGIATFSGAGAFTANGTQPGKSFGQATFAGAGAVTANGYIPALIHAQANFTGAGSFTASGDDRPSITWAGQAAFSGFGAFTGNATTIAAVVPLPVPNGRWRPVLDANFRFTAIISPGSQFLNPAPGEAGFTLYLITAAATNLPAGSTLVFTRPDGTTFSVNATRFYEGIDPVFGLYIAQGTYVAYVTTASDLNQIGMWGMEVRGPANNNISGTGTFFVAA